MFLLRTFLICQYIVWSQSTHEYRKKAEFNPFLKAKEGAWLASRLPLQSSALAQERPALATSNARRPL